MARKTKEEAEKTRQLLLDAAEDMFLEKGVAATSLEDIARHAGMTRGAVYWHFENKQALFDAMHERVKLPLEESFEHVLIAPDPLAALEQHCIYVLVHLTKDIRAQKVMTILALKCEENDANQSNVERQCQKRNEYVERSRKIFAQAKKEGKLADGISAEAAAIGLHAYIWGLLNDFLRSNQPYDMAKMAKSFIGTYFRGIIAE